MAYTEEGKILINNLLDFKCYNGKHLVSEFSSKGWNVGLVYQLLQQLRDWVDRPLLRQQQMMQHPYS